MKTHWIVFDRLREDSVIRSLLDGQEESALRRLVSYAEAHGVSGNVWRHYLARLLANDDNVFSRVAERTGRSGPSLQELVRTDLRSVRETAAGYDRLLPLYEPTQPGSGGLLQGELAAYGRSLNRIRAALDPAGRDTELLDALFQHYAGLGRGLPARYAAMDWRDGLAGIPDPDPVSLDDLVGIDYQKSVLVRNTERFLSGGGANNVLLFGDSGTGKSSCVKALVNRYTDDGLRLVELGKEQLTSLEDVLTCLSDSRHRFIVFLDDLSFEEGELGYKQLKAALEGKASVTPDNVVFYATSNRRHLIREAWSDRTDGDEEVHLTDTMQEKLSLSERFGIRVVFPSPSQSAYLEIVASYLKKADIPFTDAVRTQALQWEMTYNGRSGRTARQFVRSLNGNTSA